MLLLQSKPGESKASRHPRIPSHPLTLNASVRSMRRASILLLLLIIFGSVTLALTSCGRQSVTKGQQALSADPLADTRLLGLPLVSSRVSSPAQGPLGKVEPPFVQNCFAPDPDGISATSHRVIEFAQANGWVAAGFEGSQGGLWRGVKDMRPDGSPVQATLIVEFTANPVCRTGDLRVSLHFT